MDEERSDEYFESSLRSSFIAQRRVLLCLVASLLKPLTLACRTPTGIEERLMCYLGLIGGARGIQYFIRGRGSNPYSESAWSEIRILAAEVKELQSGLLGVGLKDDVPSKLEVEVGLSGGPDGCDGAAGAWEERDGR